MASSAEDLQLQLYNASLEGGIIKVRSLLDQGADVSYRNENGTTAIMEAASHGHYGILYFLTDKVTPETINAKDIRGHTALSFAIANGHLSCARLLMRTPGCRVNIPNNKGMTPLIFAAIFGHDTIVESLLVRLTIDEINHRARGTSSALSFAVRMTSFKHKRITNMLLKCDGIVMDRLTCELLGLSCCSEEEDTSDFSSESATIPARCGR